MKVVQTQNWYVIIVTIVTIEFDNISYSMLMVEYL